MRNLFESAATMTIADITLAALTLCNSLREGIMEDKAIIEAQQKLFDREPATTLLAIAADAPLAEADDAERFFDSLGPQVPDAVRAQLGTLRERLRATTPRVN